MSPRRPISGASFAQSSPLSRRECHSKQRAGSSRRFDESASAREDGMLRNSTGWDGAGEEISRCIESDACDR